MNNKKIYIIAGEASGDLHGSNLMKALYAQNPDLDIRFWGGDAMQKVGGSLVKHIKDLAFMGFVEVLMNIRTILKNIKICKEDILHFKPDCIVFIDYPGFNLRIAKWAKENKIKTVYYISPQIWAWKESRIHKIKASVDKMLVILPFEKQFYAKHNMQVDYVGHPLIDAIENFKEQNNEKDFREKHKLDQRPIIALLPGSRRQEINRKLTVMLEAIKNLKDYQIVVAGAPSLDLDYYKSVAGDVELHIVFGETYNLLREANLACVTSGTATLETALFKVPQVVCYKSSDISYRIAKKLIKVKYISLVNLIMDKEIVKELIQQDCNAENIEKELLKIQNGKEKRKEMIADYQKLIEKLGNGGASEIVATTVLKTIE